MDKIEKLWEKYSTTKDKQIKDQLIVNYIPLVKYVAGKVSIQVGQYVEFDDLVSSGIFGLIDAIDKYDYRAGNKFETYATLRIRGSMIDAIRKLDWIPRSIRQKNKKIEIAYRKLEQELNREPTDEELARELEISVKELEEEMRKANVSALVSLDEERGDDGHSTLYDASSNNLDATPEDEYSKKELKEMLVEALDTLNEKEKIVISLYYFDDLTLKEIAKVLEVTDSRVSQIHSKALFKLQNKLGKYKEILFNV